MYRGLKFHLNSTRANALTEKYGDPFKSPTIENAVGALTYYRTYSRIKDNGIREDFAETALRVVNGTFHMQKEYIEKNGFIWNEEQGQANAEEMYSRMLQLKFLPPGRGLWAMGTPIIHERGLGTALFNCNFTSTGFINIEHSRPFMAVMDMMMLGVGVGFDTEGSGKLTIKNPQPLEEPRDGYEYVEWIRNQVVSDPSNENDFIKDIEAELNFLEKNHKYCELFKIEDSREGWVRSLGKIIDSYFKGKTHIMFDYTAIRPRGSPLRGFQGKASGPTPLIHLHAKIRRISQNYVGKLVDSRWIADICNLIGRTVVSGNIRRSAEILLFSPDDEQARNLKNYEINPERMYWGWCSNNSVKAKLGMDYKPYIDNIVKNGEPGFIWLENCRKYGLMADLPLEREDDADGTNPCSEQSLKGSMYGDAYRRMGHRYTHKDEDIYVCGGELCCLSETMLNNHDLEDIKDFLETIKCAYNYCKTVSIASKIHWKGTNTIQKRNGRQGNSLTGLQQFVAKHRTTRHGLKNLQKFLDTAYKYLRELDQEYSENFFVCRESNKLTSIKPSGTVSLLSNSTPGMHWPIATTYIRRIRISSEDTALIECLKEAGYYTEPAKFGANTIVVELPVHMKENIKTQDQVSAREQMEFAAFMQANWCDNQVSCTITFDPETEAKELESLLNEFQYKMKSISLLPRTDGDYEQMPYEAISENEYNEKTKNIKPIDFTKYKHDTGRGEEEMDMYCDGDKCVFIRNK